MATTADSGGGQPGCHRTTAWPPTRGAAAAAAAGPWPPTGGQPPPLPLTRPPLPLCAHHPHRPCLRPAPKSPPGRCRRRWRRSRGSSSSSSLHLGRRLERHENRVNVGHDGRQGGVDEPLPREQPVALKRGRHDRELEAGPTATRHVLDILWQRERGGGRGNDVGGVPRRRPAHGKTPMVMTLLGKACANYRGPGAVAASCTNDQGMGGGGNAPLLPAGRSAPSARRGGRQQGRAGRHGRGHDRPRIKRHIQTEVPPGERIWPPYQVGSLGERLGQQLLHLRSRHLGHRRPSAIPAVGGNSIAHLSCLGVHKGRSERPGVGQCR